jgi:hypothetical protein
MASGTPVRTLTEIFKGNIDLVNDTLRVALLNDSTAYTFDEDAHEFVSDVLDGGTTAEEFGTGTGTGYSRQGVTGTTVTEDNTNGTGDWDADNVTFPGLNDATIQGAIIYKQVGGDDTTPADDPIIQVYDDDQSDINDFPIQTNGSDITIEFDSAGILSLDAV